MRSLLVALLLASGCGVDPCAGFGQQTCISLQVEAGPGIDVVRQIGVTATDGFRFDAGEVLRPDSAADALSLPVVVAVLPPASFTGGPFALTVRAFDLTGINSDVAQVGSGSFSGTIASGEHLRISVELEAGGASDGGASDADGGGPCNPVKQTGCPGSDKCTADVSTGALSCEPDRTVGIAGECSTAGTTPTPASDACKKGLECVTDVVFDLCRQFCASTSDCTQGLNGTARCTLVLSAAPSVKLCTIDCDPIAPSGCLNGTTCRVSVVLGLEQTDCSDRGIVTEGLPCGSGCADGLSCFNNVCRQPCQLSLPSCGGGLTCKAPVANGQPFGLCCPAAGC